MHFPGDVRPAQWLFAGCFGLVVQLVGRWFLKSAISVRTRAGPLDRFIVRIGKTWRKLGNSAVRKRVFDSSLDRQGIAEMAWIESHTVLIRHRKLRELARDLRLRPSHALGHLHALWHAALEQREDGNLSSWSDEFIAEMSDYPGDAPQYVRLLEKHGWLAAKKIHDWLDYVGLYLTKKYGTSNRDRLVEIWSIHGRKYGERGKRIKGDLSGNDQYSSSEPIVNQQRTESEPTVPNQPTKEEPALLVGLKAAGELPERHPPGIAPHDWLCRVWLLYLAREATRPDKASGKNFAELLRLGHTEGFLQGEILSESRDHQEAIWEFANRMSGLRPKKPINPNAVNEAEEDSRKFQEEIEELKRRAEQ